MGLWFLACEECRKVKPGLTNQTIEDWDQNDDKKNQTLQSTCWTWPSSPNHHPTFLQTMTSFLSPFYVVHPTHLRDLHAQVSSWEICCSTPRAAIHLATRSRQLMLALKVTRLASTCWRSWKACCHWVPGFPGFNERCGEKHDREMK